jgi:hypothetical protein
MEHGFATAPGSALSTSSDSGNLDIGAASGTDEWNRHGYSGHPIIGGTIDDQIAHVDLDHAAVIPGCHAIGAGGGLAVSGCYIVHAVVAVEVPEGPGTALNDKQ